MAELQVQVEFTGISRMLTGQSEIKLPLQPNSTFADVVKLLGKKYPALLGQIIEKDGNSFIPTNLFSQNGQQIIQDADMGGMVRDGDRLIVISLLAGG